MWIAYSPPHTRHLLETGSNRDRPVDKTGQQLLESLGAYLESQGFQVDADAAATQAEATYTTPDRIWFGLMFASLLLLGTLIPEQFFSDARYQGYFEKLLTWGLAAGLFARWLKSPTHLVVMSRRWTLRAASLVLLAGCAMFILELVKVDVTLQSGSELALTATGDSIGTSFWTHLGSQDFIVRDVQTKAPRPFRLTSWEMVRAGFHPTPDWRLSYRVVLSCPPPQCPAKTRVTATLQDGEFDSRFQDEIRRSGLELTGTTKVAMDIDVSREVYLPAGRYQMQLDVPCSKALEPLVLRKAAVYAFLVSSCS